MEIKAGGKLNRAISKRERENSCVNVDYGIGHSRLLILLVKLNPAT